MEKRILIADTRNVFRAGLRTIFLDNSEVVHVDEAVTNEELRQQIKTRKPDFIVTHQSLIKGINEMKLLAPHTFIILAAEPNKNMLFTAYSYGARGYLSENTLPSLLLTACTLPLGDFLLEPAFTSWILNYTCSDILPVNNSTALLTQREHEIFQLLHKGLTNCSIADQLTISEATVKTHIASIFRKLDIKRRPSGKSVPIS